jgi:hypothetical protein
MQIGESDDAVAVRDSPHHRIATILPTAHQTHHLVAGTHFCVDTLTNAPVAT